MDIINYLLYFVSGILLNVSLLHLVNFSETRRHPMIRRTKSPRFASTLWGLGQLLLGSIILLLPHYRFEPIFSSALVLLGFGAWGTFVAAMSDRSDRRARA